MAKDNVEIQLQPRSPFTRGDSQATSLLTNEHHDRKAEEKTVGRQPPSRWQRLWLNSWFAEILAIALSLTCIIALAAVLYVFDGAPTPRLQFGLTLNAIASILATAARTFFLAAVAASIGQLKWCWFTDSRQLLDMQVLDNASRGTLGSLQMLFSFRRAPVWASLGAIVTILALAFDPFVQQVITYSAQAKQTASDSASTGRASAFLLDPASAQYPSAINAGIWSDATQFERKPSCPSGNCLWSDMKSLGWCSRCADATEDLVFNSDCSAAIDYKDQSQNLGSSFGNCTVGFGQGDNATVYLDSGVLSLNAVWMVHTTQPADSQGSETDDCTPGNTFLDVTCPLMVLGHVSFAYPDNDGADATLSPLRAEQCVLSPCVRELSVSVVNGTVSTDVAMTNFGFVNPQKHFNSSRIFVDDSSWTTCWQAEPGDVDFEEVEAISSDERSDGNFVLVNFTLPAFCPVSRYQPALQDRLTGSANVSASSEELTLSSGEPIPGEGISKTTVTNSTVPDIIQAVRTHNLSYIVGNVAASLTKLALDLSDETASGNVTSTVTYVHVEWPWMVLPFVVELAAVAVLVGSAVASRRRGVRLWKTSALALLYHGLEERTLGAQSGVEDLVGIERAAGDTVVRLGGAGDGRRVVLREGRSGSSSML